MIEMQRKEFLNYWQEQKLKLLQVKADNARRLSDFNGTILHQNTFPIMCDRQEQEAMHIPDLKPFSNRRCHHRGSLSKGNIIKQAISSYSKREENQNESDGCRTRGVSVLFRRSSEIVRTGRRKEMSRLQNCQASERRQSKMPLTKYQLKEIYIPINENKDLQRDKQKLNHIQEMKAHLYQKKQILDKKIRSWCNDSK